MAEEYELDFSGLKNDSMIDELFQGIPKFNNKNPYDKQRCMTYRRSDGKVLDVFKNGPLQNSKVYTIDEPWPSVGGVNLAPVQDAILKSRIYGVLTTLANEGSTIWCFRVNKKWADKETEGILELNELIKSDIKSRRWNSAINKVYSELEDNQQEGIRTLCLASISYQKDKIPFFGRVAFGIAYANNIISLTQIPLMVSSNRDQYFTWSYVPKDSTGISSQDDLQSRFGKGGGEKDYNTFVKIRDFLLKECEPLNSTGTYKEVGKDKPDNNQSPESSKDGEPPKEGETSKEGGSENPLQQASDEINKESLDLSVRRSIRIAESFAKREYRLLNEVRGSWNSGGDDDEEDLYGDSAGEDADIVYPKGLPFINKIKLIQGIPVLGPQY